jgi:hypothetical protein
MTETISEKEFEQILRRGLQTAIQKIVRCTDLKMPKETLEAVLPCILIETPHLTNLVLSYVTLVSQEKSEKRNRYLQKWLIVFSGIAVIVPILVEVISKFV